MTYDRQLLERDLIRDEGLRLQVYRCTAGKLTIGVGRNLDDVGISMSEYGRFGLTIRSIVAKGITREQALALLDNDIDRCERDLDARLPWWRRLDPVRQRVLLNLCFNMGIGRAPDPKRGIRGKGLLSFVNTLRFMAAGDYVAASQGMKASQWAQEVKSRAPRLIAMMRTGKDVA